MKYLRMKILVLFVLTLSMNVRTEAKDYYSLTVWPVNGTNWEYPICSGKFHLNHSIAYVHISHPHNSQFTNCAPCNCKLYASSSTSIHSISLHITTKNFPDPGRHIYTYREWHKTDQDGMFRFGIQAYSSYTILDIYLNEFAQRFSLFRDRQITIGVGGGKMGMKCSNDDFSLVTSLEMSTQPLTTVSSRNSMYTSFKKPTTKTVQVKESSASPSSTSTVNTSIQLGSSIANSKTNNTSGLPLILGSISAIIILFILTILIIILIVSRRKVVNSCITDKKTLYKKKPKKYNMYSVSYHSGDAKVMEHNYIYTDDDSCVYNKHQNGVKKLKSKSTENEYIDNIIANTNQGPDTCTDENIANELSANSIIYQETKTLDKQKDKSTIPGDIIMNDNKHNIDLLADVGTEDEMQYDDSLMTQFLQELNKKMPVVHKENSPSVDQNLHSLRSTLPPQNTFRNTTYLSPNNQEINFNTLTDRRKTLPVKLSPIERNAAFYNANNMNPVYANVGSNRNIIVNDNDSHYAQIDLTSLVKPEKPKLSRKNHNIVYAELDLKKR